MRIGRASLFDEITVLEWIWNCADEPPRTGEVSSFQQTGLGSVSLNHLDAARSELVSDLAALLDHQKTLLLLLKRVGDQTAHSAVSNENRMILKVSCWQFCYIWYQRQPRGALAFAQPRL